MDRALSLTTGDHRVISALIVTYAALIQQPAAPSGGFGGGTSLFIVQIVLVGAIFYFLMFRPQQKQRQKHEEALRQLKKGDEIVTAGGIIARVVHVPKAVGDEAAPKSMDDPITIESGGSGSGGAGGASGSRFVVERGKIARILGGGTPGS
jgi:preprotein translocase subunit YajC